MQTMTRSTLKLLPLAAFVAAVAPSVCHSQTAAASSVTLYGTLDASVVSVDKTCFASAGSAAAGICGANTRQGGVTAMAGGNVASPVFGMRGSEDLGGGLRANFQLEGDVDPANGTTDGATGAGINASGSTIGSMFRRASWVGLSGSWGSLTVGRRLNSFITNLLGTQVLLSNSVAVSAAAAGGFADFWVKNAITYSSPKMNGFAFEAMHALSNTAGSGSAGSMSSIGANYTVGGLTLYGGYQEHSASTSVVVVAAGMLKNEIDATATLKAVTREMRQVAMSYNVSKQLVTGITITEVEDARMTSLQARYALSPRSSLYAMANINEQGTRTDANGARVAIIPAWGARASAGPVANTTQQALAAGVIHRF
ncbi:MAG: porin [Betaproteobacteria bacterium]|nr:porin [Betaproteobacteria bacterium]